MKEHFFYLPALPKRKVKVLLDGLTTHFRLYGLRVEFDHTDSQLSIQLGEMGRMLYPDESSEAIPFKLGKGVSVDTIRREEISCYVNGFYEAVKK